MSMRKMLPRTIAANWGDIFRGGCCGLDSSDFVFVIAPTEMATLTTPADATGPSNFHPTTVSRLLANVRVEAIG